jgi:hypothetical protein
MTYDPLVFYSPVTVAMEAVMRVRGPLNNVACNTRARMMGRIRYKSHGRLMTTLELLEDADLFMVQWIGVASTEHNHDV